MRTARPCAASHTRSSAKRIPNVWIERAELDQLAALLAHVERLAQAGLAGVQPADDLLDPGGGRLVGAGLGVLGHGSSSSMRARTRSSWKRTDTARAARAAAALVSR